MTWLYWIAGIVIVLFSIAFAFIHQPSFGRLPSGERLERIKRSPNYRNGEFRNQHPTVLMTSQTSRVHAMWNFIFGKKGDIVPDSSVIAIKTDLKHLPIERDCMVWFGHSSYLLQLSGKRILVDPVFSTGSPVTFINRPFPGTDIYEPDDMPDIDYLVISHDHWDHLDYRTIKQLKRRIRLVVCPLGVGEHFEYWGFSPEQLVEMDWGERHTLDTNFLVVCYPARHFSGRGLTVNQSLWASFLFDTPSSKVYIGGDGGYDTHFAEIGKQHRDIDLAILENGQYSESWRYIHTMPRQLEKIVRDVGARKTVTVHHSKFALSMHAWDEPLHNVERLKRIDSLHVLSPQIGEVIYLD
mgnify:CR=1 FL=1